MELVVATPLRIFEIGQVAEASSYVWIDKDRKNACIYLATEKHIKSLKWRKNRKIRDNIFSS